MKKRIVEIANERTSDTLQNADCFVVDSSSGTYKITVSQLYTAILSYVKNNLKLYANDEESLVHRLNFLDNLDTSRISVDYNSSTQSLDVNFDLESIVYDMSFKDSESGSSYAGNSVKVLEFSGFSIDFENTTGVFKVSSQDQRPYVETIVEPKIISKTSAAICQVVGNFDIEVSREWSGKIVMISEDEGHLIILRDAVNGNIIADVGKMSQSKIRAAEIWWDTYNSQFIVLKLSSYE